MNQSESFKSKASRFRSMLRLGDSSAVKVLKLTDTVTERGEAFHAAVNNNDASHLLELLSTEGVAPLNECDKSGSTPLNVAMRGAWPRCCQCTVGTRARSHVCGIARSGLALLLCTTQFAWLTHEHVTKSLSACSSLTLLTSMLSMQKATRRCTICANSVQPTMSLKLQNYC